MRDDLPSHVLRQLTEAGIDLEKLAHESDERFRQEVAARSERMEELARALRQRMAKASKEGEAEKVSGFSKRLSGVLKKSKTYRDVLRRLAPGPSQTPAAPTVEAVRHLGRPVAETKDEHGAPLRATRYRFKWPVDQVAPTLTAEAYNAAHRLRWAYLTRENRPGVADWSGAGGSVPGPRLPIRDDQLRASQEFNAVWNRLPRALQTIVGNFVLEASPPGRDAPLTMAEFGRIYGNTTDQRRAAGVSVGAIATACAVVERLYREYDSGHRGRRA